MLSETVKKLLESEDETKYQSALDVLANAFGAQTATVHRADSSTRTLHLVASRGLPEHILTITRTIPFGKGMAGICAERQDCVTVCNLQTDDSGVARPSARETGVAGAIVVPILAPGGGLLGTLGIGKPNEHDYTVEETQTLESCARAFASIFAA